MLKYFFCISMGLKLSFAAGFLLEGGMFISDVGVALLLCIFSKKYAKLPIVFQWEVVRIGKINFAP